MKTEYVGYGPSVDAAWDVIANDSMSCSLIFPSPWTLDRQAADLVRQLATL